MDTLLVAPSAGQEVEVLAKARRRRFSLEYKRRILGEADRCRKPGEVGALLRREGLYSSQLSAWRAARERENRRLRQRAERAEALVEVQKNSRNCWGSKRKRTTSDRDGQDR